MRKRMVVLPLLVVGLCALSLPLASARNTTVPAHAVVKVAFNKTLKKPILVDARGLTLYMYSSDSAGNAACVNDATYHCSKAWPPLLTKGAPTAGPGAKASLLSTAKRSDGGLQVQYKGHPLYTDAGAPKFGLVADKKPGDVNGQRFLEIWWALSPTGARIQAKP